MEDDPTVRLALGDKLAILDQRAHLNRNLRFRPPENLLLAQEPDFDFLQHEFSGRFLTQKGAVRDACDNSRPQWL
jgi:hypothetical protein